MHHNVFSAVCTGTESIDTLVGSGVSVANAIILLDEIGNCEHYCWAIQRCAVAEGLVRGQSLLLASPIPGKIQRLLREIPGINTKGKSEDGGRSGGNEMEAGEEFKIAWRYRTAPVLDSSIGGASSRKNRPFSGSYGGITIDDTKFDLASNDESYDIEALIASGRVAIADWQNEQPSFAQLWKIIFHEFANGKYRGTEGAFLRIIITDISSVLWKDGNLCLQFVAHLKTFCRNNNSMAMISMDSSLFDKGFSVQTLTQYSDVKFRMQKMDQQEIKALCLRHKIDGRFFVDKLPTIRSAAPAVLPTAIDLLFSLKKHFFEVKLLHLPPALGEGKGAEKNINKPKSSCQTLNQF